MKLRLKQSFKWLGYITVTIMIIFLTIALVIYGQGYGFNPETGKLTGGGLFYINSQPTKAEIFIDGEHYGSTEERVRMPAAAEYQIDLYRDGYRTWSNKLPIKEKKVTHLQYPRLIPDTVPTVPLDSVRNVNMVSQSSDQEFLAVAETGAVEHVRIFATGNMEEPINDVILPGSSDFTITGINWSSDDSHLLITATSGGNVLQFVLSAQTGGGYENVTNIIDGPLKNPEVLDSAQAVYGIQGNVLRRFNLREPSVTNIALNVRQYDIQDDVIYAIQKKPERQALIRISANGNVKQIAEYPSDREYEIHAFNYNGETRLAMHDKTVNQASLLNSLGSESPDTESLRPGEAEFLSVSPGGRFVVTRSGKHFTTKDIKRDSLYRFTLEGLESNPVWYSNHHLLAVSDGKVIFFDFDGTNQQFLTRTDGQYAFGNREHDEVYSFRRNTFTEKMQLQKTVLE